jgi:nicotinamide-nucleotide adenylyltransferase
VTARGMIHGRFQPFHNGHLDYLKGAAARCDEIFVGITNPDPERIKPETSDPLRHLPESNPYTYVERLLMVKAAARDAEIPLERLHVIPFPVNEPELWRAYVPEDVVQFIRLFSDWGGTKLERLRGRRARGAPVRGSVGNPGASRGCGRDQRPGSRARVRGV